MVERDFPVSMNVIIFHLLHHLPFFIRCFGPVSGFWMYPYERFNSWISRRVNNRRYPEATVVETVHLKMSGKLPESFCTIFDRFDSEETPNENVMRHISYLDDQQIVYINSYYREANQEYNNLCNRYNEDKDRAKKRHQIKRFPSMPEWIL